MSPDYLQSRVAVDAVIFSIDDGKLKLLLHEREKEPFEGLAELPGGLLLTSEAAEDAMMRKLTELIGTNKVFFQQFHTFSDLNRDPRGRAISIGFIALVSSDYVDSNWFDSAKLPKMAFDHASIVKEALSYLKKNISSLIVQQFLPNEFPLNKLQDAYELIEGVKYDNRNFRKKMISSGIVKETGSLEINVSHRPAKLFKFVN